MPADSWPRCWSANRPERGDRGRLGRLGAGQRPTEDAAHQRRPRRRRPSRAARGRPWSQACAQVGERRRSSGVGDAAARAPRPRRWRRLRRAGSTSRSPPTRPSRLDRQAVLAGEQRRAPAANRGVAVTTIRDGLSPNSSTAGDVATATRTSRAEAAPHRALGERHREAAAAHVLGASATQAAADRLADERLQRRLARRGRAPAGRPRRPSPASARVGGAGQARRRLADQQRSTSPRRAERRPDQRLDVVEQPDDADLGVGAMAPAGDSL